MQTRSSSVACARLWRVVVVVAVWLCASATAAAQTASISCTDASATNCSVKKNQPFSITADPALTTDTVYTEKWRLYMNGAKVSELANVGVAPKFSWAVGLATPGDYQFYLEAVGTCFDGAGAAIECSSGPSATVILHVVTGSLSAPKNVRIVGGG